MAKGAGMKLKVPIDVVSATLAHLKSDGGQAREGVVLWLGRRAISHVDVVAALRPEQDAGADMFRIPPASMSAIMARLRNEDLMIGAQVHSHPQNAFHSAADDAWAIVRHVGALSLVVPFFGLKTTLASFFDHSAVFVLSAEDKWVPVANFLEHVEIKS